MGDFALSTQPPLESAKRKLTAVEQALVDGYFARERKIQSVIGWTLGFVGLGVVLFGFKVFTDAPGPALGLFALGVFVISFPRLIATLTRRRPSSFAVRVRATCRSELVQGGMIPWLGPFRVEMLASWVPLWRDGAEVEVDVCPLLHRTRDQVVAVFLLSLPGVSSKGAPLLPR